MLLYLVVEAKLIAGVLQQHGYSSALLKRRGFRRGVLISKRNQRPP